MGEYHRNSPPFSSSFFFIPRMRQYTRTVVAHTLTNWIGGGFTASESLEMTSIPMLSSLNFALSLVSQKNERIGQNERVRPSACAFPLFHSHFLLCDSFVSSRGEKELLQFDWNVFVFREVRSRIRHLLSFVSSSFSHLPLYSQLNSPLCPSSSSFHSLSLSLDCIIAHCEKESTRKVRCESKIFKAY